MPGQYSSLFNVLFGLWGHSIQALREWVHKWSSSVWVATYRVLLTMPTEQSQWRPAMPPFLLSPLPQSCCCCLFPDSGGEEQYRLLYPFPLTLPPLNQLCVRVSPTFHYTSGLKLVYVCFVFMSHMLFWSTMILKNKFSKILKKR